MIHPREKETSRRLKKSVGILQLTMVLLMLLLKVKEISLRLVSMSLMHI